jgi:hypothetical protein
MGRGGIRDDSSPRRVSRLLEMAMCFILYAGTSQPIPRREWSNRPPNISVSSLTEHDRAIRARFESSEVQSIGSTAGCGCDFPHVLLQNGEWPTFEFDDAERVATFGQNRRALAALLRDTGEKTIELYGLWWGNFAKTPLAHEEIPLLRILEPDFLFREQAFYRVFL